MGEEIAKNHEKEGEIVAQAGHKGGVTVATNMAGRGVDIKLGGVPFNKELYDFKKNFGIKFGILRLDRPISRFYDYQKGDVIRITRNDGYINYRIVKG